MRLRAGFDRRKTEDTARAGEDVAGVAGTAEAGP